MSRRRKNPIDSRSYWWGVVAALGVGIVVQLARTIATKPSALPQPPPPPAEFHP